MIYIVDIEKLETRYTAQWATYVPKMLTEAGLPVEVISGDDNIASNNTTPGMFLNFSATNIYKSQQVQKLALLFDNSIVKDGDYFLFTDAWHPGVINLKYMADLLNIKVKIGGLWHAGNYDPWDGLGQRIGSAKWVNLAEQSFFHCYDHNYFATDFHINLFIENMLKEDPRSARMSYMPNKKIIRTGWPMAYMNEILSEYKGVPKHDLILFPHRISAEKQVEIFRDLAASLPQYEFVVCQDKKRTKHEYHTLLAEAKMIFSCSNQETLGISTGAEGPILRAIPIMPNRLSYTEMFADTPYLLYPSEWTTNWDAYQKNKHNVIDKITDVMEFYNEYAVESDKYVQNAFSNYFDAAELVNTIKGS